MGKDDRNARPLLVRMRNWLDGQQADDLRVAPAPRQLSPAPAPDGTGDIAVSRTVARASRDAAGEMIETLQAGISASVRGITTRAATVAFNASQPVGDRYELSGRLGELQRLTKAVVEGGQHAVIYGARGVGKTSLARVFGDLMDEAGCDVFYHSASGDAEFEEIIGPYLRFIGESGGRTGTGAGSHRLGTRFGARDVADLLSTITNRRIFLVLDEFDRITNARARAELAALLKLLSDFRIGVQFVIVGISNDVDMLVEEHPSLRRHMAAIRVGPINGESIARLLLEGSRRAEIHFEPEVLAAIVTLSLGSPYHARLMALQAALHWTGPTGEPIGMAALDAGLDEAWASWAAVSASAARTFTRLAADHGHRMEIAAAAMAASMEYAFDEHDVARLLDNGGVHDAGTRARVVLDLLQGELQATERRVVFRDSLAPQFLLLAMVRADDRPGARSFDIGLAGICDTVRKMGLSGAPQARMSGMQAGAAAGGTN